MKQKNINLGSYDLAEVVSCLDAVGLLGDYNHAKHLIQLETSEQASVGYIRLPLHLRINDQLQILDEKASALYVTITAGNAAISLMRGEEELEHKTFTAYMTRGKRGFSQIKYLNKKGKSKAGSRVRLASTVEFFEKINTRLTELIDTYNPDRLAISCATTLIPYLYQAKTTFPIPKKDPRLYKIPLHLPQSNHSQLVEAIRKLYTPRVFYSEDNERIIQELMNNLTDD